MKDFEADESRFVTKVRWIIESRNGHLENFKALGDINNTVILYIMQEYKIVASIINCFYRKLYADGDKDIQVAVEMKNKIAQKNKSLTKYWNKIDKDFKKIEAHDINDFPRLDLETIKNKITFGSYQIKYCFGYLSEHFDQNGSMTIVLNKTEFKEETVLSVKVKSRHVERLKYKLIIVYFPNINDVSSISGWKCSCTVKSQIGYLFNAL